MTDEIKINKSHINKIFVAVAAIFAAAMFFLFSTPYTGVFVFTILLLIWGSYYALISKKHLSEMCCMMSGMAFGMISGFFVGTLVGLATGDFLIGMVAGTIAGVLFGIPTGRMGGALGRMEGVMAGPMGGIMGGMVGIMIRFFNVELFMPFFMIVVLFTVWEMANVIKSHANNLSKGFITIGIVLSLLAFSSALTVNIDTSVTGFGIAQANENVAAVAPAPIQNGAQEVKIRMEAFGYNPDYIVVKNGVPVKLTLEADQNAGCTRAIVFPDFNIKKTVPRGGTDTVEFTPTKPGTYRFSCTMNMAGGTLVVQ